MNTRLQKSKIIEHVYRRLGASGGKGVEVEIDEEDINSCIRETIDVYNRYRPRHANATLSVTHTQKRYGPLEHPGIQGVTRLEFVRDPVPGQINPFDPWSYHIIPDTTVGGYAQQLSYMEQARRVLSSETEWHFEWGRDGKPYLYIDIPEGINLLCSYTYTWHVTPDDDPQTGMQFIPNGDCDWVLAYTTALAKQVLARIRGKWHGVNMPDGGVEDNDYSELMQEGREDQEKLLEDIRTRVVPVAPVIG